MTTTQGNTMTMKLNLPNVADDIRKLVTEQGSLPPVESWHPERVGDIDICIDRSGKVDLPRWRNGARVSGSLVRHDSAP